MNLKQLVLAAIAAVTLASAFPALAQSQAGSINGGCIGGANVGGLLGHQVGRGDGRTAATAIGSVLGCNAGQTIQSNNERLNAMGQPTVVFAAPQYAPPQGYAMPAPVSGPMPTRPFAPYCLGQWHGQTNGTMALSPQGSMALSKVESLLRDSGARLDGAQARYSQAYEAYAQASDDSRNPQTEILMGSGQIQNRLMKADQNARAANYERLDAEKRYFAEVARALDACEFSAARGEDVTAFARLEALMTRPMADTWSYTDRSTGRTLSTPQAMPRSSGSLPAPIAQAYPTP